MRKKRDEVFKKETDKFLDLLEDEEICEFDDEDDEMIKIFGTNPKEEKKYEFIKKVTPFDLLKEWEDDEDDEDTPEVATHRQSNSFVKKMVEIGQHIHENIEMTEEFHSYLTKHPCFVEYMIKAKYIREVKPFSKFTMHIRIETRDEFLSLLKSLYRSSSRSVQSSPLVGEIRKLTHHHKGVDKILLQVNQYIDKVK